MTFRPHDHAKIRCVCLPEQKHARILLQLFLERVKSLDHLYDAPTLMRLQEEMYAQLSRAEIPSLSQISQFLSIYAVGAVYKAANDQKTLYSRYWQMLALYMLAEQSQVSSDSVEELQTMLNILLLTKQQPGSLETFRSLHALCINLGSGLPMVSGERISTVDVETRRIFRRQIERLSL